jgi:hypothetical protein
MSNGRVIWLLSHHNGHDGHKVFVSFVSVVVKGRVNELHERRKTL